MKAHKNILIAFILNFTFSIFEFFGGVFTGSIAIISDSIHDLGDAVGIAISYFFERKSRKKANAKYTYGYVRFSVLGGAITTLILMIGSIIVVYTAVRRLVNPVSIEYDKMIIFAIVGLVVNGLAAYFTHGGGSINQRAVNLHMLEDVFGWFIVLIGAIVMRFTNWYWIDPILSILVAGFIIFGVIKNLKKILDIFLLKTPKNIDIEEVKEHLLALDGVLDVHHVHVWTLDGDVGYASLHVVATSYDAQIKAKIKEELKERNLLHVVVEIEGKGEICTEKECEINVRHPVHGHCGHHH